MSGSKDVYCDSTRKRNDEKANNNDVTFIVLQKSLRSVHSSERIEEMFCEPEGYRWDVLLWCERGEMTKQKHGRHIINTSSWEQENMTTHTALVSY